MSDLIKREDAIKVISDRICDNKWVCECAINSLPSAQPQGELISKADAIRELVRSSVYAWSVEQDQSAHNWAIGIINSLPTAEAVGVVRCKDCKFEFMCKQTVEQANADDVEHRPLEWCSYGERESTNE